MVETKYGKYFFSGLRPGQKAGRGLDLAFLDDESMKGSHFYRITWMQPTAAPTSPAPALRGRGPHIHKYTELLVHLGTNPDDPFDLGAEVEMCMGKEMEPHIITKSTVVYIPANFLHAPWTVKRADRPWIFMQINQGPKHTTKEYPQILPKEMRGEMIFDEEEWF